MSEIKPALTAEEWEARQFSTAYPRQPPTSGRYEMHGRVVLDNEGIAVTDSRGNGITVFQESLPALAALALYGQSFGFTREDVDDLRDEAYSEWYDLSGMMPKGKRLES